VTQETVLAEADRIVNGQRREDYGGPFESFSDIGAGWAMVLGHPVTPEQVALCMIQLKVARAKNGGFHRDSFVDIAGYAQCAEFIAIARAAQAEDSARVEEAVEAAYQRVASPVNTALEKLRWRHELDRSRADGRLCEWDPQTGSWRVAEPGTPADYVSAGAACGLVHE
jgi:hypothetical protein